MARIFICGDLVNQSSEKSFIDEPLQKIIQSCDYSICNFEGPILDASAEHAINGNPKFKSGIKQHVSTLNTLTNSGFNMLLLANNHITDMGYLGVCSTLNLAKKMDFDFIGAGSSYDEAYRYHINEIGGMKIGYINISTAQIGHYSSQYLRYGYAWMGDNKVPKRILDLRKQVDILILFCHVGLEHQLIPLREIRELFRDFCDLGVDYVIGGHPHVPQGYEMYNDSLIFYSLGNFYFPNNGSTKLEQESFSVILNIDDKNRREFELVYHSTKDNVACLSSASNMSFKIEELNDMLSESKYDNLVDKVYDYAYQHYKNLYMGSFQFINENFKEKIYRHLHIKSKTRNVDTYINCWLKLSQCEIPIYILNHHLQKMNSQI